MTDTKTRLVTLTKKQLGPTTAARCIKAQQFQKEGKTKGSQNSTGRKAGGHSTKQWGLATQAEGA